MKIVWSEEAALSYEELIDFILEKWTVEIVDNFIEKLNSLLFKLSKHKNLCPKSAIKNLRKCLVSEQTSLIYRVKSYNLIEIVLFVDNRSKHPY
mgnify:FL=1